MNKGDWTGVVVVWLLVCITSLAVGFTIVYTALSVNETGDVWQPEREKIKVTDSDFQSPQIYQEQNALDPSDLPAYEKVAEL